jgi:hypothetical protein
MNSSLDGLQRLKIWAHANAPIRLVLAIRSGGGSINGTIGVPTAESVQFLAVDGSGEFIFSLKDASFAFTQPAGEHAKLYGGCLTVTLLDGDTVSFFECRSA